MELKPIEGYTTYFADKEGNVYSNHSGEIRRLKPWVDTKGNYMLVSLYSNGHRKNHLIHRLVAQAWLPNPLNLPEINHKDKNPKNNRVENLEWCTRKDNLIESYTTMSPARNCNACQLLYKGTVVGQFASVVAAARYAQEHYQVGYHSISKYLSCGNVTILAPGRTPIHKERVYDHRPYKMLRNGKLVGKFASLGEAATKAHELYGVSRGSMVSRKCHKLLGIELLPIDSTEV